MGKGSRRATRAADALAALKSGDRPVLRTPAGERVEDGFTVRSVGASDRVYRCPGCAQEVSGVPHLVAWPEGRPDERRHWHTPCWGARGRRGPTVERGRGTPRH
ncbi:MAG: hypothetical protein JWN87_906 [Frankiales bacterium]|jgi:hypothetical protein|nr:hypothetical protein [Frankiales bacterium]MCW2584970.1 hypothetical protein [Frankiales bacterium]